ncbi:MAG: ATPase, partial [Clostridia bacterium]|nr:ATPase [Clostridia bacterium]
DKYDNLLVPFRTWRNTTTKEATNILTEVFQFNIPQRWSVAHLYQAILNNESHVPQIAHITTLAGYVHFLLTGKRELGMGDASGMFPVCDNNYDSKMLAIFNDLIEDKNYLWDIESILPGIKKAGETGAYLTEDGAEFLDLSGNLQAGIPVCPPEGDAGTGMVATNSVLPGIGNVSAGTSAFSMLVLKKPLKKFHSQIDIVTTPDGADVAMIHCNNCCGELDTWVNLFGEFAELTGNSINKTTLYELLYRNAMLGDSNGIVTYNYLSGEHITEISKGRPMCFRVPERKMCLADFMKAQLYSSSATLSIGMDILFKDEQVTADKFSAHGGLFKVPEVAQQILTDALKTPVSVTETSGEGGAWGMALLAAYMMNRKNESLGEWLETKAFSDTKIITLTPIYKNTIEFENYKKRYKDGLDAEKKLEEVI